MSDPVFFVDAIPRPGSFELGGDEGRHAATVKRLRRGERLVLCDGAGNWAGATVAASSGRSLTLAVEAVAHEPEPELSITLIQALPKGERSDLAVDLATESGIDEIVPWQAARCVARWSGSDDKADRGQQKWQRVAREAAKQSRRRRIPTVCRLAATNDIAERIRAADLTLVLHEDGSVPLTSVALPVRGRILLVVGPEGGVAPEEIDLFEAAGARTVRLGPQVLRTSTAAAVALGALSVLTGRWS
ncbi:MAG: 16S rRNA (uracil(1498)-N(3))-methyltransferase [Nakamurella sp.]